MKISIEKDDGTVEVFERVTDLYVVVRRNDLVGTPGKKIQYVPVTTSHSWGSNVRELVKEVQQSLVELQDWLREHRHGGTN